MLSYRRRRTVRPIQTSLSFSYQTEIASPGLKMCYRQLRFTKNTACGHLTFQGDTYIDCLTRDCMLSTSHPTTCGSPGRPCNCRRYYRYSAFLLPRSFVYRLLLFSKSTPAADHTRSTRSSILNLVLVFICHVHSVRGHVHSARNDRIYPITGRLTTVCIYISPLGPFTVFFQSLS